MLPTLQLSVLAVLDVLTDPQPAGCTQQDSFLRSAANKGGHRPRAVTEPAWGHGVPSLGAFPGDKTQKNWISAAKSS